MAVVDESPPKTDLDPLDVHRQLAEMKALEDGWADGMQPASRRGEAYGKAPSEDGLAWLAEHFAARYAPDLPRPYLYPTPEGGVQAEWSLGPCEASLEIDLAGRSAEWHCLNVRTNQSKERVLDLGAEDGWQWLNSEVRRLESPPPRAWLI